MHMQIIGNYLHMHAPIIAFVVPYGQPCHTYPRFLSISDTLTTSSTRKFAQNSGSGDFRADNNKLNNDGDDRTDYFTPLRMRTG